jgi:chemotaxis protein histidine kinase CheA
MNTRSPFPTDFLLQTEDLIARLDADLADLREANRDGRWRDSENLAARRQLFERLFRHTHTLKGAAATFGALVCARLAHEVENALHALRKTPPAILNAEMSDARLLSDEEIGAALQEAVDVMSVSLRVNAGAQESEIERAATAATRRLAAYTSGLRDAATISPQSHDADASPEYDLPPEWRTTSLDPAVIEHLREVARDDVSLFVVTFGFALATFDADYLRCDTLLRQSGEIIATRPLPLEAATLDGTAENNLTAPGRDAIAPRLRFSVIFAAKSAVEEVCRSFEEFDVVVKLVSKHRERTDAAHIPFSEILRDEAVNAAELVRVPLDALDELASLVAELHDDTQSFFSADEGAALAATRATTSNTERRHTLRHRFLEVQEKLLRLRMVTTEARLQEAARAGRVAARACGKTVVWRIEGGDVRLDKSLAENLSTPLAHPRSQCG